MARGAPDGGAVGLAAVGLGDLVGAQPLHEVQGVGHGRDARGVHRLQLVDQAQDILADDLPVIPLFLSRAIIVYNKKVADHTIDATGVSSNFAGVWLRA